MFKIFLSRFPSNTPFINFLWFRSCWRSSMSNLPRRPFRNSSSSSSKISSKLRSFRNFFKVPDEVCSNNPFENIFRRSFSNLFRSSFRNCLYKFFFFRNVSSVILGKFPKHYTNLPRTFLKAVHFFKLIHNFSELQWELQELLWVTCKNFQNNSRKNSFMNFQRSFWNNLEELFEQLLS